MCMASKMQQPSIPANAQTDQSYVSTHKVLASDSEIF